MSEIGQAVLVTTQFRGVFFGYIKRPMPDACDVITLTNARNCIRWEGVKGFLGLAATGPNDLCRIGARADQITLRGVTCVANCTVEAIANWEKAPWN